MRVFFVLAICLLAVIMTATPAEAQSLINISFRVTTESAALPGAAVAVNATRQLTDQDGRATLSLPAGPAVVTVTKEGFVEARIEIVVVAADTKTIAVALERLPNVEEAVTVSATRTGGRIDDIPTRVEVLNREEIEEKLLMTPGDIVMMLNEMGGLRVQVTSPGLGAATVRVQGMPGRYTRFFSDGLPLFGEVGGLGLLQIPPMDLGQVEVIKGVASSLYGAGAMGGVVNLVSRQPGPGTEREILVNQSSRGATDVVGWYATPAKTGWALTLVGGGHRQSMNDVDEDTWADLAGYTRAVVRPRVFWNNGRGHSFFATAGFMTEDRNGGTVEGTVLPVAGVPYAEALDTRRIDGGFVGQMLVGGRYLLNARAAVADQHHMHQFGEILERDQHRTTFAEVTIRRSVGPHTFVAGAAFEHSGYANADVPQFDFRYNVPGVFGQADLEVRKWLSISASARIDHHSRYGTFVSPRVSALFRSGAWTSRMSTGMGFYGPSALTEETEAAGLTRLDIPVPLRAERGRSASVDLTHRAGPLNVSATLFGSRVLDPTSIDRSTGFALTNLASPTTTAGLELLATFRRAPYAVTGTYGYVRAFERPDDVRQDVPLTPRHSAGIVGMWEREGTGRIGVECYVTGAQALEDNPYRSVSRPYVVIGVLVERRIGPVRVFVNGENLTGVRQTKWDPLIRPARASDGRWTVDAWAPLDGRNINGGVRFGF